MTDKNPLRTSITIALYFAALIWGVKIFELIANVDLYRLGVYPRAIEGLPGILTGPLIHGSWTHLIGNTLPTIMLGSMLIYGYPKSRFWAISGIWLLSGIGVWLFARSSFHFGASGLTHGMFFYLFVGGILRRDKRSAAILMVAFYMYGGMLLTIFPGDPGVSFESHLFGALAGALLAYLLRDWDSKPPERLLVEDEDPIIGDQWKTETNDLE